MHVASLAKIAQEYRDINPSSILHLDRPPSSVEFARLIHISRPVLIRNYKHIDCQQWTPDFLIHSMGNKFISVAITPQGQGADALARGPNGVTYFAEPHVQKMTMSSFLSNIVATKVHTPKEVFYLQSQNGNLYPGSPSEFDPLLPHVPPEITWASEALGDYVISNPPPFFCCRSPDAVNLWIGDSRSTTSIHADPYENIYTVIRGVKYFTVVPPTEAYRLNETLYPHAQYNRLPSGSLNLTPTSKTVRWSSIADPSLPGILPAGSSYSITVHAGETLYLPPGWWHYVRQSADETGICVALNWWYDMEMQGMNWVWLQYMRGTLGEGKGSEDEDEIDG